ncbi:MAG: siderophore-interacting protein [Catenulispora sp.]|nr:siderophore-interacting protein [Catenulispora sp.]
MRPGDEDVFLRLAEAGRTSDAAALRRVLTPDVVAICDSGGLIPELAEPVCGVDDVAMLLLALIGGRPDTELAIANVNGRPGLVLRRAGKAVAVLAAPTEGARIGTLWIVLNPAKLPRWHCGDHRESHIT